MSIDRTDTGAGVYDGDETDNLIDAAAGPDADGDVIDGGDASLPGESGDQDIVNAGDGNDTVFGGADDDELFGGAGDDELNGGAGNDLLAGDRDTTDNLEGGREAFRWSEAPDPDGADGTAGIDGGDALNGFTLNTGSVDVTFSTTSTGANNTTVFADNFHLVTDVVDDGSGVDPNSSLDNVANGEGNSAEFTLNFSDPVENVSFRINDVDADGVVTVTAFGPNGPITVNLTGGANVTLLDTDGVPGADTADSNGGNEDDSSPNYSVLVDIPGPVSQIVVEHAQDGPANSSIKLTDVFFDAVPVIAVGDDTLNGEEGADDIQGGDDADLIIGANGGDTIDGGSGGDDNDTLDLRDSGPLNIVDQEVDPDGNSTSGTIEFLDPVTGAVTGISNFSEIENLLLPDANTDPDAVDDNVTTAPGVAVDISVLTNDDDVDGDTLTVFNAVDGDNGTVVNNGDGTVTYTPNPGFVGTDSFFYDISDGRGGIDSAEVFVTISDDPVPPPPTGPDGVVSGTAGADVIDLGYTGDPDGDTIDANDAILPGEGPQDDIVEAGDGDDTVRGRDGDDDIRGGDGDDSLRGDAGDDLIDGGDGDDILRGDAGDDILEGRDGDDTLFGGSGENTLLGGDGDDSLVGGTGSDIVEGGTGEDTIVAEPGDDTIFGGDGSDLIEVRAGGNHVITGGEDADGSDIDVLDLSGVDKNVIRTGLESGRVEFLDGAGNVTSTAEFSEIERVICFTPGTAVATPQGLRPVEDLRPGDTVITRDNGIRELCWTGQKALSHADLKAARGLRPVFIKAGALGEGMPDRDMMVSPNHRMLLATSQAEMMFGEREVLVAAKHLTGLRGVRRIMPDAGTTYIHVMCDRHEVLLADGVWSESFQPGEQAMQSVSDAQRDEIVSLFLELALGDASGFAAARVSLKSREAQALLGAPAR